MTVRLTVDGAVFLAVGFCYRQISIDRLNAWVSNRDMAKRWIVRAWAHDKKARNVAMKAISILERTMDHIHATGMESDFDLSRPSEAAIALLQEAVLEVNLAEKAAHKAKAAQWDI